MSRARLVITAVVVEKRPVAQVAADYGVPPCLGLQAPGSLPSRGRGRVRTTARCFRDEYNTHRPHRSLARRTPTAAYAARPKATPTGQRTDTHDRVRHDRIDDSGVVTLRHNGRLHHIGIGRTHARTHVIMLVQDLNIRVIATATGELLRQLTLDYQPRGQPQTRNRPNP